MCIRDRLLMRCAGYNNVDLAAAKSGVMSAVILGVGRAIGETMAVVMVAGNQTWMPKGLFQGLRKMCIRDRSRRDKIPTAIKVVRNR